MVGYSREDALKNFKVELKGGLVRLKKLVITGFKSFAEKTTLHFEKGITCIVGPNGCGKSNIADAFRWVLGEQSAKSLRGHKMPDVIFAGASKRQCLNFAEVSLTLTDIQGALPIEYEEVTITRRLHRSGESEYFLNSNPVRLKDIHSLLLDSGIGKNAFSIFEQGKIDQIINYSPVDRRFIFEEAAGIVRFLVRKQEAFKRLEQADLNLSRVQDIHLEVEKNILLLQKQAEKASRFKENQLHLENLEKTALVMRWESSLKKKESFENRLGVLKVKWKESLNLYTAKREAETVLKKVLEENEKKRNEHQNAFFKFHSTIEIKKNEFKSNIQRIEEFQRKSNKFKRDLEDLALIRQNRQTNLIDIQKKREKIEADLWIFEQQLTDQGSQLKDREKEVFQLRQEVQTRQQSLLQMIQQESNAAGEIKQLEFCIDNDAGRSKVLIEKLEQIGDDITQFVQMIEEKKMQLQQLSDVIDVYKDRLENYEHDLSRVNQQIEVKKNTFENARKKNFELKARHQVLLKMQEDFEGFSVGSKALIQESSTSKSVLYSKLKPLYEFFKPDPEVAEALSAILRGYSQTLVVTTESDLKIVLQFAQEANIQDFSLVCVERIEKFRKPADENSTRLLEKTHLNTISRFFLKNVEIWNDLSLALTSQELKEGWILQGGYFDHRGVFFQIKLSENQVFTRESELTRLGEEIADQDSSLQTLEEAILHLQQKKNQIQNERIEIDGRLRRDEMKLVEVNFGLQRALSDQEKDKLQLKEFENELVELQSKIKLNIANLENKTLKYGEIESLQDELKVALSTFEVELNNQQQALNIQQQDEKEKGLLYQKMIEDKNCLKHESHLLESKEQDYEMQRERMTDDLTDLTELQISLQEKNLILQDMIKENEAEIALMNEVSHELESDAKSLKLSIVELNHESLNLQNAAKDLEIQMTNLKVQLDHAEQAVEVYQSESLDKYALDLNESSGLVKSIDKSLDQIEKEMRHLKQILNEAGDVNLMAIEELEKHQVRYEFLSRQMSDLSQTKQELMLIINQLDAESRRLFRETFDLIRTNFQKNFAILFNGGEADLQFVEGSENILDAGIEIIAKPPGKQMRSISLLSGGEKCLTAVALLFAIFEVKSSPFCILDEIDAPLDDTNIDRFVNVVRHFADRCQFLIITHNKRTMAISDMLFGVSMEEKGVSKLLSLEFSHESRPETALIS